jgi:endogenous inhibitor of DNA gyrase (YacG/DUF329 family)
MWRVIPKNPRKPVTVKLECGWCGKAMVVDGYRYRSRTNAGQVKFFCSQSCAGRFGAWAKDQAKNPHKENFDGVS